MRRDKIDWNYYPEVVDGVLTVNVKTKDDIQRVPVSVKISKTSSVQHTDISIALVAGSGEFCRAKHTNCSLNSWLAGTTALVPSAVTQIQHSVG